MTELKRILDQCNEFIQLEMQDAKLLEPEKSEWIKLALGLDHPLRTAYYNPTTLILTDIDDFREITGRSEGCEVLFKIESHLNEGVYILSYINNKRILALLGGGNG